MILLALMLVSMLVLAETDAHADAYAVPTALFHCANRTNGALRARHCHTLPTTPTAREEHFKDSMSFTPGKTAVHDANTSLLMSPQRSMGSSKGGGDHIAEFGGEIKVRHRTHSLTHSLSHPFPCLLTRSLTHSLTYSLDRSLTQSINRRPTLTIACLRAHRRSLS